MATATEKQTAVEQAVALVNNGESSNAASTLIGDKYGVTGRTIQTWCIKAGRPLGDLSSYAVPQKAIDGHKAQAQERRERIRLLILEKAEDVLNRMDEPHVDFKGKDAAQVTYPKATSGDVRNYAFTFGILLDKYRLEMGEATGRVETVDVGTAVQVVDDEIARLRERRAESA